MCKFQVNVYSKEGVCLGAVAEQETWVWTCKLRPGPNNNQVVRTITRSYIMGDPFMFTSVINYSTVKGSKGPSCCAFLHVCNIVLLCCCLYVWQ